MALMHAALQLSRKDYSSAPSDEYEGEEAPVYHPTIEEFADPLKYIERLVLVSHQHDARGRARTRQRRRPQWELRPNYSAETVTRRGRSAPPLCTPLSRGAHLRRRTPNATQ